MHSPHAMPAEPGPRAAPRRILVAGRLDALGELSALLRGAGDRVDVSYDVDGALEMLVGGAYHAVLCDLSMPGGGGVRFLRERGQKGLEVPVVLITRHGERPELIAALRHGAFDYLEEPFDFDDVALAIGRAARHRELLEQRHADEERLRRLEATLRRLNATAGLDDLLGALRDELPALLGVSRFSLYRYQDELLTLAVSTHLDPATARPIHIARQPGALRDAVLRGRSVVTRDPAQPSAPPQVAVPMFVQAELVGVLVVEPRLGAADPQDERHQQFYQAVGAHVGSALRMRERAAALEKALGDLQAAQAELIRSERIAAVGRLASGIAHELKNPLTSMTFAVQNLRDLAGRIEPAPEALGASLDMLADDIRRMRDRVQTFLSVARPRSGAPVRLRLDELVRRVVDRFRSDPRAAAIALEERYQEASALCDEDQLFAAVSNLLLNALEALGEAPGGRITVAVERAGGRARIRVADNGPGVPPEARERIFEVFYTTKPGGTGLGLSQVFVFAERAGGTVSIEDACPGASFVIELPEAV